MLSAVPRRCVNLPPGSLGTLLRCALTGRVQEGPDLAAFHEELAEWLGAKHAVGADTGRAAFQLALEALELPRGCEIVFPEVTFPIMPAVAQHLGFVPVFCPVDPATFNAGPEQIEPVLGPNTGAVLATHLFGRPAPIAAIADLCRARGIRLLEDCAHACGVRVGGRQVGTFGDVGVFSFAQGKNMPSFGGVAISTDDDAVAARARAIRDAAPIASTGALLGEGASVWAKWLVTRPLVFGLTAYRALRWRQRKGQPLMDSAVGDELVAKFLRSSPTINRLANLQAAVGRRQLRHIDAFNQGARRNAEILTAELGDVPGVRAPSMAGEHIYVYYPLAVDADKRDDLRHWLLRHGIDTKTTDMSDCSRLDAFRGTSGAADGDVPPTPATLLEICVYPSLSAEWMRRIARAIRAWADQPQLAATAGTRDGARRATA